MYQNNLLIYLGGLEMTLGERFITSAFAIRGLPTTGLFVQSCHLVREEKRGCSASQFAVS